MCGCKCEYRLRCEYGCRYVCIVVDGTFACVGAGERAGEGACAVVNAGVGTGLHRPAVRQAGVCVCVFVFRLCVVCVCGVCVCLCLSVFACLFTSPNDHK